jgi:cell wall-associated NlpC family hydrolase
MVLGLAVAYRHPDVTPQIAQAVVAYASAQINKKYDLTGAALAQGLICRVRDDKQTAFFCSELVMEAFKQAGVPLGTMPSQCYTPGDVAEIGIQRLIYVGHLKGNTAWFPKLSP